MHDWIQPSFSLIAFHIIYKFMAFTLTQTSIYFLLISSLQMSSSSLYITLTLTLLLMPKAILGTTITLINRCDSPIWPGLLSNAGSPSLDTTGFELPTRASRSIQLEPGWSGRFWGRTGCSFDPTTGQCTCATGDCGSNQIECNGGGAAPPATLAEFTIGSTGPDFYDVSLVDGYNLPMIIEPAGGSGACGATGCVADLNRVCPKELRAGDGQACKSACEAFGSPEYCCSGAYGSPSTCRPSVYSEMFKSACPRSYSYAYDDATSTFTCSGADYTITFCPSRTSKKSTSSPTTTNGMPNPVAQSDATRSTTEPSDSPLENSLPSWLPTFMTGGSPNLVLSSHFAIYAATIFLSLSFIQL